MTHTVPARPLTVKGERTRAKIVDTAAALIVKDGVAGLFEETHREISAQPCSRTLTVPAVASSCLSSCSTAHWMPALCVRRKSASSLPSSRR